MLPVSKNKRVFLRVLFTFDRCPQRVVLVDDDSAISRIIAGSERRRRMRGRHGVSRRDVGVVQQVPGNLADPPDDVTASRDAPP